MKPGGRAQLPPAVVLGLGINGLGIARALGRMGVPSMAVTSGHGAPPEFTRYCRKVVCPTMETHPEDLVPTLLDIGRELDQKTVIFPTGDLNLAVISEHRDTLAPYFHLPIADLETLRLIMDKGKFYRFAMAKGLPIARTFFPASPDEARAVARETAYPCLIKPSIATPDWREHGLKLLAAGDPEELMRQFEFAFAITQDLVVQEVTPGPDSAVHFSLTYLDRSGTPRAMFTAHKLRQNVPRYGITSMAESLYRADVDSLSRSVLQVLGYRGLGSVEFKEHARTGALLITEITGRTTYPHALSERCGLNLPFVVYADLLGLEAPAPVSTYPDGIKWIDEWGDFLSARQYRQEGVLTTGEWLRSYRGRRYWALASWDDPMPFARFLGQLAVRAGRRALRAVGVRWS